MNYLTFKMIIQNEKDEPITALVLMKRAMCMVSQGCDPEGMANVLYEVMLERGMLADSFFHRE